MPPPSHFDAVIIGGGIAGLWTCARLRKEGLRVLLLTNSPLGAQQTIWSQGIIHGGVKYALGGEASAASREIARMPEIWRSCLNGTGEVDLRTVKPLSESQYLWTTPGFISRIAGVAASKAIRTPVERLDRAAWPALFAAAPAGIDLYAVAEPVLPTSTVLEALKLACGDSLASCLAIDSISANASTSNHSPAVQIRIRAANGSTEVSAGHVILTAGAGNAALLATTGIPAAQAPMQTRPLHMVMVKGDLPDLFGHCLGHSTVPRITVTTSRDAFGTPVWWIGGGIAEDGVSRDEPAQFRAARDEITACLPWIKLNSASWSAARIDRAEGLSDGGKRPDGPIVRALSLPGANSSSTSAPIIVAWPTKLAFAPRVAELVLDHIRLSAPQPREELALPQRDVPCVADPPWDDAARAWHKL